MKNWFNIFKSKGDKNPENIDVHLNLGKLYLDNNLIDLSLESFELAQSLNPNIPELNQLIQELQSQ